MELAHASHSVYKIRYHMVFQIKYRKIVLSPQIVDYMKYIMNGIQARYNWMIDEIGFDQNHIHVFVGAPPTKSPMEIYTAIKSITARKVFARFSWLKTYDLWGGEFWSDGKYVGTVGEKTSEEVIRRYIQGQGIDKPNVNNRLKQLKLFKL